MGGREHWLRRLKDQLRLKGGKWCVKPWSRCRAAHIHRRTAFEASISSSQGETAAAAAERGGARYRRAAAAAARHRRESDQDFGCILDQAPAGDAVALIDDEEEEMNLAMALATERRLRAAERDVSMAPFWERTSSSSPLMRLMKEGEEERKRKEEVEVEEEEEEEEDEEQKEEEVVVVEGMEEGGEWWRCCVCMERRKGAAFIPCGHTFCRVCARELWVSRGSCPLCNQLIIETLDIY